MSAVGDCVQPHASGAGRSSNRQPAFSCRALANYSPLGGQAASFLAWMSAVGLNRLVVYLLQRGSLEACRQFARDRGQYPGLTFEGGHHSFAYWLPPARFFSSHPELFALVQGRRVANGQLCLSHPDIVTLVVEAIRRTLSANPFLAAIGLWPNDRFGWCECASCQALYAERRGRLWPDQPATSGAYLAFANQVAERLATTHPDVTLDLLAYLNYVEPPATIAPHPGLTLTFAPLLRCLRHAIDDPACPRNAAYRPLLETWRARWPGSLRVFEYYLLPDHWSAPYPVWETMAADVAYYRAIGVDGLLVEYRPEEWDIYGLHAYTYARWLNDPSEPTSRLLREFCEGYYQEAAGPMEEFLAGWSREMRLSTACFRHLDPASLAAFEPGTLQEAVDQLARAERSAASAVVRRRIRSLAHSLRQVGTLQQALAHQAAARDAHAAGRTAEAQRAARQALASYEQLLRRGRRLARSGCLYYPRLKEWVASAEAACAALG